MKKTISLIAGAILCGGILLTGCSGGSDVKSNTQESVVIQDTSGNSGGDLNNITENPSIEEIGSFKLNGSFNDVSAGIVDYNNTKAFISDQTKLYAYTLENIAEPELLNTYDLFGGGNKIALSKDNKKLFIDNLTSLLILDANSLNKLEEYVNDNSIIDFVLSNDGKTIFLTDNSSLKIIDVSDPTFTTTTKDIQNIEKLFISNDDKRLYCLVDSSTQSKQKKELIILDITEKTNPNLKGQFSIGDDEISINDMEVSKDGKVAILKTNQGIVILNINRSSEEDNFDDIKGTFLKSNDYIFDTIKIASNNKIVFGVRKLNLKVDILDISDLQNPKKINNIDFSSYVPYEVFLSNDETKLFVATIIGEGSGESPAFGKTRVYIFDVSSYTKK